MTTLKFSGYASLTDTPYDMGWYSEVVSRGAFRKTLAEKPDVVLNLDHGAGGSGLPIARTKSGTLRLEEDNLGLKVSADLDTADPDVALLAHKMGRGDLDGQMSFAFRATRQNWNDDNTKRYINEANIHRGDVSIVTQGASPTTFSSIGGDTARSIGARIASSATATELRWLADKIGDQVHVLENRGWALTGAGLLTRGDAKPACNRCSGSGSISLNGSDTTCPQCKGSGGPEGNKAPADTERGYSPAYYARLQLEALRYPAKRI